MPYIDKILAREILDSRGNPTLEVEVHTLSGFLEELLSLLELLLENMKQ